MLNRDLKKWVNLMFGDTNFLEMRYRNLYGEMEVEKKITAQLRNMKKKYAVFILIFVALAVYSLASSILLAKSMDTEEGIIKKIRRPSQGEAALALDTRVWILDGENRFSRDKAVRIEPQGKKETGEGRVLREETYGEKTNRRVDSAIRELNKDRNEREVILPTSLQDGRRLIWQEKRSKNLPIVVLLFAIGIHTLYRSRYYSIRKEERQARESIVRELPEFINKFILILNSGLVVSAAFEKIIEDYTNKREQCKRTYFMEEMYKISLRVEDTNASMEDEIRDFAKRSGVREFLRVATIIWDNVGRGANLSVKLQREGELLWFARKKESEERGKLAESKLTLPLAILLMVLVLITIAPAMLEM